MVYPSGLDAAMAAVPSVPDAPGLLSMTIGLPRIFSASLLIRRITKSPALPEHMTSGRPAEGI
jgi:hypothetical protein